MSDMNFNHIYSRQGGTGEMRCSLCGVGPWLPVNDAGCEVKIRRHESKGTPGNGPIQLKYLIPPMLLKGNTK